MSQPKLIQQHLWKISQKVRTRGLRKCRRSKENLEASPGSADFYIEPEGQTREYITPLCKEVPTISTTSLYRMGRG